MDQLIPPDLVFDGTSLPTCFASEDHSQRIAPEDLVRLKIVGLKLDASEIVCFFILICLVCYRNN